MGWSGRAPALPAIGCWDEGDLEAEAAAAAKIAAQDAKAGPSSHLTPACPCRVRINSRSNTVRPPIEINCRKLRGRGGACGAIFTFWRKHNQPVIGFSPPGGAAILPVSRSQSQRPDCAKRPDLS
jgi:hypothetical protein